MPDPIKLLIYQLQYGYGKQQQDAYNELKRRGIPENTLRTLQEEGRSKKNHIAADATRVARPIKAIEIPDPFFLREQISSSPSYFNNQQNPFLPNFGKTYSPSQTYISQGKSPQTSSIASSYNFIPLSQLGLALVATGSDYTLHVKNYDLFKDVSKQGKFIADYNGQKLYKLGFRGNQYISPSIVAAEKAAFASSMKTLKFVKVAGVAAAGTGVIISGVVASQTNTASSWTKFGLDVIMTGVAFIPGPGWVIAGIYFLADASLSVGEVDWWTALWDNYLSKTDDVLKEAWNAFERADAEHRRITGKGLLSGPKY